MWYASLILSILLIKCTLSVGDEYREEESRVAAFMGGVIILITLYGINAAITMTLWDCIIQFVAAVICVLIFASYFYDFNFNHCIVLFALCFSIFCGVSVYEFVSGTHIGEQNDVNSKAQTTQSAQVAQSSQNEQKKRGIAWDYANPEEVRVEYSIIGVSGENIVINVYWNGENSLRSIPINEIKVEYTDAVLKPYIYRINRIYTEYDYDKTPPKALRQDSEMWTAYTLCGSEKQIQELFGYEENLNFEQ